MKIGENGKSPIKFRKIILKKNHISATLRPTEMVLYVPESENYLPTIMFYEKNHFVTRKKEKMVNIQLNLQNNHFQKAKKKKLGGTKFFFFHF